VAFRWTTTNVEQTFDVMDGRRRKKWELNQLRNIERLGQAVLSADVYFKSHPLADPTMTPETYRVWTSGHTHTAKKNTGVVDATSPVSFLFPMLECSRSVSGPVGLYWLLPMLFLMTSNEDDVEDIHDTTTAVVVQEVVNHCPDVQKVFAHFVWQPVSLCQGLPAGCAIRLHEFRAGDCHGMWIFHHCIRIPFLDAA